MIKVYLDASIIIAAFISKTGGSAKVLDLIRENKIMGITSQTVVDEIEEHLDKFKKTKSELVALLRKSKILIRERIKISEIEPYISDIDQDDAHLIAGANLTECDFLISLDKKHLLREDIRNKVKPLKILSPGEFLSYLITV